jgi:hypothetical protein
VPKSSASEAGLVSMSLDELSNIHISHTSNAHHITESPKDLMPVERTHGTTKCSSGAIPKTP